MLLVTTKAQTKTFDRWVGDVTGLTPGEPGELEQYLRGLGHFKPVEHLGK